MFSASLMCVARKPEAIKTGWYEQVIKRLFLQSVYSAAVCQKIQKDPLSYDQTKEPS